MLCHKPQGRVGVQHYTRTCLIIAKASLKSKLMEDSKENGEGQYSTVLAETSLVTHGQTADRWLLFLYSSQGGELPKISIVAC
jgi:hypothetical protein